MQEEEELERGREGEMESPDKAAPSLFWPQLRTSKILGRSLQPSFTFNAFEIKVLFFLTGDVSSLLAACRTSSQRSCLAGTSIVSRRYLPYSGINDALFELWLPRGNWAALDRNRLLSQEEAYVGPGRGMKETLSNDC